MSFTQKDYQGKEILLPNSVIGYRQWYWSREILSSYRESEWTNGYLTSVCKRITSTTDSHRSPDVNCSCGIYAHYLPLESYEKNLNVFGVVEASGKLLMGTKGFRAEKAKVVALAGYGPSNHWFETKEKTRGVYPSDLVDFCTRIGVPYFPTVKHMVYEFPQVDLTSLGVPSLDDWKSSRDIQKALYEKRDLEARERVEKERSLERELTRRFGMPPNKRMAETMRHLGGFQ